MNNVKSDFIDYALICTGTTISLMDIQTILSIVLLTFNVLWLLIKFIVKIKEKLSDGKLTPEEIKDLDNDFQNIKDKINGGDK